MLMRLKSVQSDEMAKLQLQKLFDTVEMPLVDVLIEMETQGFKIDSEALRKMCIRDSPISRLWRAKRAACSFIRPEGPGEETQLRLKNYPFQTYL